MSPSSNEFITVEYDTEILIDKEKPDDSYVWAGIIQTPKTGEYFIEFSDSSIFGILGQSKIKPFSTKEKKKYIKSYDSEKTQIKKILNMSEEETRSKFNKAIYKDHGDYIVWEDAVLFNFYVSEDNNHNGKPTEYAGKYVFIEYHKNSKDVYIQAISKEEYGENTAIFTSKFVGRVDNKYYMEYGYYDLEQHKYVIYNDPSYMCQLNKSQLMEDNKFDFLKLLKQHHDLSPHLTADSVAIDRVYLIDDRIYLGIYYAYKDGKNDPMYHSWFTYVMLDANTYEVLYAEKYYSTNYSLNGYELDLYHVGEDGMLYEPYIVLDN